MNKNLIKKVISLLVFYKCTFQNKVSEKTMARTEDLIKELEKVIAMPG